MAVPPRDRPDQWAKWAFGIVAAIVVIIALVAGVSALTDDDDTDVAVDDTTTTEAEEPAPTSSTAAPTSIPTTTAVPVTGPPSASGPCVGEYDVDDGGAERFLTEFMRLRVAGTGAERCVTRDALEVYEREGGGDFDSDDETALCLYSCGDVDVVAFEIGRVLTAEDDQFEASLTVVLQDSEGTRYEYTEFVEAGSGRAATGEQRDLLIRSAGRDL